MKRAKPTETPVDEALRMLIVERPGYLVQRQRDMLASLGHGVEYLDADAWARSLRPGDRAALCWLHLLAPAPGSSAKPLKALDAAIDRVMATRAILIEAATGARSDDVEKWPAARAAARDLVRSGRHMTRREARKRGEKGRAARPQSAKQRWEAEPRLMKQAQALWKSRAYSNDRSAWVAVNGMLEAMDRAGMRFGSPETARRVLGNRT